MITAFENLRRQSPAKVRHVIALGLGISQASSGTRQSAQTRADYSGAVECETTA
jgi:hypothetical protein